MTSLNFDKLRLDYKKVVQDAFKQNKIEIIENKNRTFNNIEIDIKNPLDHAFRDITLQLLEEQVDVSELQRFVKFCIKSCQKGVISPIMPVVLLGDIFDTLTLDACEEMFTFVENEVNVWKEDLFFIPCKNNLLRLCNDLLRRLSRSSATVFCGRILLFLAKFFPFTERSGLNIVSEFNLENITEYGTDAKRNSTTEHEVTDSKNIVIDYSLYCKFWSLQDFFRNPIQVYNKVQWKVFCLHASSILSIFAGLKLEHISKEPRDSDSEIIYFSKYLTNQKLLDLQIYDVNFRRFVLLQFLIMFQYLTTNVKFKTDVHELKSDQKEWVQNNVEKIYDLLKETPPDGERFAEIVKNILAREEHWNVWKNSGCPEFKKQLPTDTAVDKGRKSISERPLLGDIIKEATNSGKYYMGSPELTKLWNLYPDNLEACKAKDRNFLPTLESYFAEAIDQLESPIPVKDEENLLKDGNFGWRALRLLAKKSPHFFIYSNNPINKLPDYLTMMVKKIAAERPGRVQETQHEQMDAEMEENLFKEEIKQENEEFVDDSNLQPPVVNVTLNQLQNFAEKVAPDWKKLAVKLGFKDDEIKFFEENNEVHTEMARNMLQLWFEDDEDATLENLLYILEGLEMTSAAEAVRNELYSAGS